MLNKNIVEKEARELFKELLDEEENKSITNPIEVKFKEGKINGIKSQQETVLVELLRSENLVLYTTSFIGSMKAVTKEFIDQRNSFSGSIEEKGILFGKIAAFENYKNYVVDLSSRLAAEAYKVEAGRGGNK